MLQLFFYCWTIAVVYPARAAARRPYNARAPAKPARECVKNSRFCQGGIFLLQQFYNSWTFAVGYTARATA